MTQDEAYRLAERAMQHFNDAGTMLAQMATMATWTPEYTELSIEADAELNRGRADHKRYQDWCAEQNRIAAQAAEINTTTETMRGQIVANWRQFDATDHDADARALRELEAITGPAGPKFDRQP
jgi:hypothetical protein